MWNSHEFRYGRVLWLFGRLVIDEPRGFPALIELNSARSASWIGERSFTWFSGLSQQI